MKIATWNVNGIRARHEQFAAWAAAEQPDVICLQEIKAKIEQIPQTCSIEGYTCYWHGAGGYSGVGLHIRRAFADQIEYTHPSFDLETRIVQAQIEDTVFTSVYVPNGGKDFEAKLRFLGDLEAFAASHARDGIPLVICGDLNVARSDADIHPKERKLNQIGARPEERALFERVLSHDLVDVQRTLNPDATDLFTWWPPWRDLRKKNVGWRIDYVLASTALHARTVSCIVEREVGTSDHGPVTWTFE
jgi:exodeoxyribonuclease III